MESAADDPLSLGREGDRALLAAALQASGYGVLMTGTDIAPPGPVIRFVNPAFCRLTGYSAGELIGATPRILQGPRTDRAMLDRLKQALREERGFAGEAFNYRKDGSPYVVDWVISPVRDDAGVVKAWVSVQRDVTRRHRHRIAMRETEERLNLLIAELQHRTRNLMGVVRAIAGNTLAASDSAADFKERFETRLDALARVQGLLSRLGEHDRVTFAQLIRSELAALDGAADRVRLTGPEEVRLRSSSVQTLAIALHELATNAVKYGALGQADAQLDIDWRFEPQGAGGKPWLHIDWRESGVAMPAAAGDRRGQGRELIEEALPYQFGAEVRYRLGADGVRCTISLPVSVTNLGGC